MPDLSPLPQLLRAREVAEWLGISEQALAQDRFRGGGIPYVRLGENRIRYRMADLVAYVESNTVIPDVQEPTTPATPAKERGYSRKSVRR